MPFPYNKLHVIQPHGFGFVREIVDYMHIFLRKEYFIKNSRVKSCWMLLLFAALVFMTAEPVLSDEADALAPVKIVTSLEDCDLAWDSPSGTSFGSMPLGNGDIGINIWVENNGDVVFYVSKVDAYSHNHRLPKLGRVRLKLEPALAVKDFQQKIVLRNAAVEIKAGDVQIRVWVDANCPVIRVEAKSGRPRMATLVAESLQPLHDSATALPDAGTVGLLFKDNKDRIAWCYRNQSSEWAKKFNRQNSPEMVAKVKDPILHRSSGCVLRGRGFVRDSENTLKLKEKSTTIDYEVRVLSSQPDSVQAWLTEALQPVKSDWAAHCAYWKSFWNRSQIFVSRCGDGKVNMDQCRFTQFAQWSKVYEGHKLIDGDQNAFQISQRYALERFCEAAASRGVVPPPFNGSIFTMDMPAGVLRYNGASPHPMSPDKRDWIDLTFFWQNTRHPYWAMGTRGDYDTLLPGMQFVRDGLDICRDRCKRVFGIDGAFIMEGSWWYNVGIWEFRAVPSHLRYHQLATIEIFKTTVYSFF